MIARSKRAARAVFGGYADAMSRFSRNAWLFLITAGIQWFGFGVLVTVFAIYIKTAGMTEAVIGYAEGAAALASAFICLLVAPLIAVFGYRRLFVFAAILYGVSRLGQAGIPEVSAILMFGAVFGAGDGFMQAGPVAFLAENSTPVERSHLYTMDLIIRVMAAMLGGIVGGMMPAWFAGLLSPVGALRATVAVGGVLFLVSAIPLYMMREKVGHPRNAFGNYLVTVKHFQSWPHIGRLIVPQLLISTGAGVIIPFLSLYMKEHLGASLSQVGWIQGISQLAMGVAALGAPWLGRKLGIVKATVVAEALSLPFLIAIPFVTNLWVATLVFWLRAAFMNMSWPTWNQYTMEDVPSRERPLVASMLSLGWSVAWFAGSAIGGKLMATSYTIPYAVAAVLYGAGTLATWLLLRGHQTAPVTAEDIDSSHHTL